MQQIRFIACLALLFATGTIETQMVKEWVTDQRKNLIEETLPNGLTVVIYPMRGCDEVRVGIAYDVGSKDELPHEHGLAHMVEHIIFKGTKKMSEADIDAIASKYNLTKADYGAATNKDLTRYWFNTDKNHWPIFVDILADCMFNVRFDENPFASEVKVVIEELQLRETNLVKSIYDMHSSMVYPFNHPYYSPTIGSKEVLLQSNSSHLKEFYKRNYHPSRAILTIIGDVDPEAVLKQARLSFASSASDFTLTDVSTTPPKIQGTKKQTVYKPLSRPVYCFFWLIPSDTQSLDAADCFTSLCNRRLRALLIDKKNLAFSVGIRVIAQQRESIVYCFFEPKKDATIRQIKELIFTEIEGFSQQGASAAELERYKRITEMSALEKFEQPTAVAELIEENFFPARSTSYLFERHERMVNLKREDITSFGQTHLKKSARKTIIFLPFDEQSKAVWLQKREEESKREKEILATKIRAHALEAPSYVHTLPPAVIPSPDTLQPDATFTLSNGLSVYLKKRESPFVSASLRFKDRERCIRSLRLEKKNTIGELAFSLLRHGCAHPSTELLRNFNEIEGKFASSFSLYESSFTCLPDNLKAVGNLYVSCMKDPRYEEHLLQQQIHARIATIEGAKLNPKNTIKRLIQKKLYGEEDDEVAQLRNSTPQDLLLFNKQYIHPERMFLVVVGNFDPLTIKQDLEEIFGPWKNDSAALSVAEKESDISLVATAPEPAEIYHHLPIKETMLAFARITDTYDSKALLVLELIENYLYERIYQIRGESGLFYSPEVELASRFDHQRGFAILAFPLSCNTIDAVERSIKKLLEELSQKGIPSEAIALAKQHKLSQLSKIRTNQDLINRFSRCVESNRDFDSNNKRLEQMRALTKEEIDDIVRVYLDPKSWTVFKVGQVTQPH